MDNDGIQIIHICNKHILHVFEGLDGEGTGEIGVHGTCVGIGQCHKVKHILHGAVVGRLYSVQYKSIFGVPDKVRQDMCDKARPLSQVLGVEPNTSLGNEVAEPPHHHQIIVGMRDCILM
jgi:hypothetical protein